MPRIKKISPTVAWGLKVPCTSCGEKAGDVCRTWRSKRPAKMHTVRESAGYALMRLFDTVQPPQKTPMCTCPVCLDIVLGVCLNLAP